MLKQSFPESFMQDRVTFVLGHLEGRDFLFLDIIPSEDKKL